jgi:hypothetical protein
MGVDQRENIGRKEGNKGTKGIREGTKSVVLRYKTYYSQLNFNGIFTLVIKSGKRMLRSGGGNNIVFNKQFKLNVSFS